MLWSLSLLLLCGLLLGALCRRAHLPPLLGMLLAGLALGPHALNLLDPALLSISADLRRLALIIILTRAGLSLDIGQLRRVGRPAILLCFVPACFEIAAITVLAPPLLGVSRADAAVMGAVLAAVSPAVVVPKMLALSQAGYGMRKGIPQMIMAAASVDDVFVIVLFTAFVGLARGQGMDGAGLLRIPVSIALGVGLGLAAGWLLRGLLARIGAATRTLVLLGISCLLVAGEELLPGILTYSGLLAVMALGGLLRKKAPGTADQLARHYAQLWTGAEVLLFGLVGAAVNPRHALQAGPMAALLLLCALAVRMAGVYASLLGTKLSRRERLFCMIAYCPKATVQAAIGAVPLSLGLAGGEAILTVAALAILITAPLGALGIEATGRRLLSKD